LVSSRLGIGRFTVNDQHSFLEALAETHRLARTAADAPEVDHEGAVRIDYILPRALQVIAR